MAPTYKRLFVLEKRLEFDQVKGADAVGPSSEGAYCPQHDCSKLSPDAIQLPYPHPCPCNQKAAKQSKRATNPSPSKLTPLCNTVSLTQNPPSAHSVRPSSRSSCFYSPQKKSPLSAHHRKFSPSQRTLEDHARNHRLKTRVSFQVESLY